MTQNSRACRQPLSVRRMIVAHARAVLKDYIRFATFVLLACLCCFVQLEKLEAGEPDVKPPSSLEQLRERAGRGLQLIEHSAAEYLQQRECFSCHHQAMAILTCMEARTRGFAVDHENLVRQVQRTAEHLQRGEEQYRQGIGQGGKVDTAGYALLGLATAGWPADHTTEAVSEYLLRAYADKDHWICSSDRPPTETHDTTTSALAVLGLKHFARGEQESRAAERFEKCAQWLSKQTLEENEQQVFGLLAAHALDRPNDIVSIRQAILGAQRDDGGWSQTAAMESDAYATGTAMFALARSGYGVDEEAYRRGLQYLIQTQLEDGSWHVATRSRPIQKYFESGFPHGVDQFISMAATGWATISLMLALPKDEAHLATLPKLPWSANAKKSAAKSEAVSAAMAENSKARELSAADVEFFERDIRPLLLDKCVDCHGPEEQSADLRVDSLEGLLGGGESGPAVIRGAPDRSLIIRAVRREGELKMPPDDPLSDEEVSKLRRWIELGAPWPKADPAAGGANVVEAAPHWAFQPITAPRPPEVINSEWANNAIDRFVLAKLEQHNVQPAAQATHRDILRRLSYDLIGLPPTAAEQEAFAEDDRPDAHERAVDRLLASPRFGEQWGRHWLDIARYSDTKGYVYAREERFFIHAATYRDWVIDALASDLPYDRFVLYQLAADQIAADDLRAHAAMGFLTVGRRFLGVTHDIIDDRIDVVTRGLLGLTVSCARCHDHKYDAISTADYYSLYGVFQNSVERRMRLSPRADSGSSGTADVDAAVAAFEAELEKREQRYQERLAAERATASKRVREKFTEYLLAQLELEKYPAEGFDVIIAADDLVPAHVRRIQAYLLDAAEREDSIFVAWRRFEEAYKSLKAENGTTELAATQRSSTDDRFAAEAVHITAQLAQLPPAKINPLVLRQFDVPPSSMRQVAERYGQLFSKLSGSSGISSSNADDQASLVELERFWKGPASPCEVPDEDIVSIEQFFASKTCEELWKLQGEVDRWINQSPLAPAFATVLRDREQIREPHILRRGNPRMTGKRVPRQFLTALQSSLSTPRALSQPSASSPGARASSSTPFQHGSGRRELADAIVDPRNPLTSRVWTNRIWQHLFGQGLVATPSDFGVRAEGPSHPELLDWLASDFLQSQQSNKRLIRQIVLSSTYRQAANMPSEDSTRSRAVEIDPNNRLLWRATSKRLTFEQQRDTWLMVAGQLDCRRGGRAQPLFDDAPNHRRTIYGLVDRQFLPGVLRVFDFANPDLHTPQRSDTTVPQQALFALNHAFVAEMARSVVRTTATPEPSESDEGRVERLYRQVLGRNPRASELADALEFLEQPETLRPRVRSETLAWQYGFGKFDVAAGELQSFARLPHFTGAAWQGSEKWPDAKLGWVQLTAQGGHAGNDLDHAAVRRWIAPRDGTLTVRSQAAHDVTAGDGVRCSIVSSRGGLLTSQVVHNRTVNLHVGDLEVKAGDTIDFVVDFNTNLNNDQFRWSPELTLSAANEGSLPADGLESRVTEAGKKTPAPGLGASEIASAEDLGSIRLWHAERDFSSAQNLEKLLDQWEQLAQVLLLCNELAFVD